MNNFGVIEVASTKTTNAPGWAYVPDTRPNLNAAGGGAGTASRKRARNAAGGPNNPSYADLTARQEAKVRKELEVLDRDNSRDVVIPIPSSRSRTAGGGSSNNKHTPNVRKILQSQKTFANHLDDFVASGAGLDLTAGSAAAAGAATASSRSAAAAASAAISRVRAAGGSGGGNSPSQQAQQRRKSEAVTTKTVASANSKQAEDVEMTDASEVDTRNNRSAYLKAYTGKLPPAHKFDDDPLLVSTIPPLPSDEEIRALLSAPPLTYLDAKAGWNDEDRRYPTRVFCAVCGYWGRVRCMKCGVRVCALECLETHREECVTRYGL